MILQISLVFKSGVCSYALFNVLADVEGSGDFLVLSKLDISRAFDSCIIAQILSEAIKRGFDPSVINFSVICIVILKLK